MSIVGAQGVSMSELTGMGLDRLNAMAQGQQPSIAPSYLVLAAIEQLKKGKAGEQAPMPQGTVKDRLLASVNQPTPMQSGIGQMAQPQQAQQPAPPTQMMAGGGSVEGSWVDRLPEGAGARMIRDYFANPRRKPILDAIFSRDEEPPELNVPKATMPTIPQLAIPDVQIQEGPKKPTSNAAPAGVGGRIFASASSRGVGGLGTTPLSKYNLDIPQTPSAASFQLDIPKNQQLADAAAKFSAPDAARMAELKGAEDRAGLGAFARGMVNTDRGRGFGAVFGSAAADWNDAREKRADMRREYEDKRQEMATKLSIAQGEEARDNFLKSSEWGAKRAEEAWTRAAKGVELGIQGTHYGNQEKLEQTKLGLMAEANRIAAEVRRDGLNEANFAKLLRVQQQALEAANKPAETQHGKVDPTTGQALNPNQGLNIERTREKVYRDLFPQELEATMNAYVTNGMNRRSGAAPAPAAPAAGFRGRMGE